MKILYYFRKENTVMFTWQVFHIVEEMTHYNCNIEIFNPLDFCDFDQANEKLLEKVKKNSYDLFMTCHNESVLHIETLVQIKKKIPTLLFCPDNLVAPFNHEHIAPLFDLVWLTSKETEYIFKKWGCNTVFQPYAANPFFLKPMATNNEEMAVGFIGTPHGSRIDNINFLLKGGVPVVIHSSNTSFEAPFFSASSRSYYSALKSYIRFSIGRKLLLASVIDKFSHRTLLGTHPNLTIKAPIPLPDIAEYNGKYALVLSFTDANSTGVLANPVKIVNLRNFEIPMSGGLQFTMYSDEIAEYFKEDEEIILCGSRDEMIEKAKYYLKAQMSETRKRIRLKARERAEKDHTWKNRFDSVLHSLNLKVS